MWLQQDTFFVNLANTSRIHVFDTHVDFVYGNGLDFTQFLRNKPISAYATMERLLFALHESFLLEKK